MESLKKDQKLCIEGAGLFSMFVMRRNDSKKEAYGKIQEEGLPRSGGTAGTSE